MSFKCPNCHEAAALNIVNSLQVPPDDRSDDILLQVIGCSQCGFRGLAVYEESRRGALETDSWDHTGYKVDSQVVEDIEQAIRRCPDPFDWRCQCPAHLRFSDNPGRRGWTGLKNLPVQGTFRMNLN
jgi:ferredoxin